MTLFGPDTLATLELALTWHHGDTAHEERYLARRVNPWRDIMPPGLTDALTGCAEGDTATVHYTPGELIPDHDPRKVRTLSRKNFNIPAVAGRTVPARAGRFYPQGHLRGLPCVHPQNATPFRLLNLEGKSVTVDLNHPLAGRDLALSATVQSVEEKRSDTGGRLSHWAEELCNWGPGMQDTGGADVPSGTDDPFFARLDRAEDAAFYDSPRLVSHIDRQASANLERMYARFLKPGMRVLDLMSSMDSHLPHGQDLDVTGLGLNMEELEHNPLLNARVVHDLNRDPALPEDVCSCGPYDAVVCSLSVEYLTDPVAVLQSARSVLAPGGVLLLGLSDRWFPSKAVLGWMDLHPFERPGLALSWARLAGFTGESGSVSMRNDWRPTDDPHFLATRGVSDPVFAVWTHAD